MKTLMKLVMVLMVRVIGLKNVEGRKPELHRVGGGKNTWAPNINFTDWALHEHFYVGDWLYFGFDKSRYNVLEVNETSYEKCIDQDFTTNITRGGRDVFNLTEARPYYFLSSGGYCFHGMKLAINVTEGPPALAPAPAKSGGYCPSFGVLSQTILFTLVVAAPLWFWHLR